MTTDSEHIRTALLRTENTLREAIGLTDPYLASDRASLSDLQEALGLVARWRVELECGRWEGRPYSKSREGDEG